MHTSGIVGFSLHAYQKARHLLLRTQMQQGFIDERAPPNPAAVDSSRTADEGEDGDEQDDEMSEPIQTKENRKGERVSDGRNSKRVTGIVTCS